MVAFKFKACSSQAALIVPLAVTDDALKKLKRLYVPIKRIIEPKNGGDTTSGPTSTTASTCRSPAFRITFLAAAMNLLSRSVTLKQGGRRTALKSIRCYRIALE
ncbi:hypothetical protein H9P43_008562 [Blastocladiella emersonii ATCC 22665]|nr:hypothetical protein H9P43_008562 [Blastocladiella emersonii ATCC 22665]